jgi:hypothetical protein
MTILISYFILINIFINEMTIYLIHFPVMIIENCDYLFEGMSSWSLRVCYDILLKWIGENLETLTYLEIF